MVDTLTSISKEVPQKATIKENAEKVIENDKEYDSNIEKAKNTEAGETEKLIAQKADTETAKSISLSSLIESTRMSNESKESIDKNETNETNESKEGHEGLTDEQKEKLRELTGWSDEVIDAIGSWQEAEIYMKAGLKEVEINGKKCLIRDDIDLDQKDEDGITNREHMERGEPPVTKEGKGVELHHIGQHQSSPLAELTMEEHRGVGNDSILHDKTKETEIDRNAFSKERKEHWEARAEVQEGANANV